MTVTLKHKQEFADILRDYSPSEETERILSTMPLVIMLGLTGSGRNTIIDELVRTRRYHFIVSDTTRPAKIRDGKLEEDGVIYNFRKEEDFLQDLREGKFLEAEIIHNQQVSGISVRELEKAHESSKVPINEVDIGGTEAIASLKPDTVFIFVLPPSYDEWMRRLHGRETMSDEEFHNRLVTAQHILESVIDSQRFVFIVNDKLDAVVETIDQYVQNNGDAKQEKSARKLASQLLEDIKKNHPGL